MSFNFKPINEVPEVESISDGDKVLINSNGTAKQIDASKIGGGGGGGGTVYLNVLNITEDLSEMTVQCYADEELTQAIDYETGKKLFMSGACGYGSMPVEGSVFIISINFCLFAWEAFAEKSATGIYVSPSGTIGQALIAFSDTNMD